MILDFWATWCGACIESFPKMHELKKKFDGGLQVLLVNSYKDDDETKVKSFFDKRKTRTGLNVKLPYVLNDTITKAYFPHSTIPHYVWLNKDRVVIAITGRTEVTEMNVSAFIEGRSVDLPIANDSYLFNVEKPLLVAQNGGDAGNFLYRSLFTGFKENLGYVIGKTIDNNGLVPRMYAINCTLYSLFQIAYPDVVKYSSNRTIIEDNRNDYERSYCYEIITPPVAYNEILKYMQTDLYRNFRAVAKKEVRQVSCFILRLNNKIQKSITSGERPKVDVDPLSLKKFLQNEPVSSLADILEPLLGKPVIDETGLLQNIDISLPYDFFEYDREKIKKWLSIKGFELLESEREMEVAVISPLNTEKNSIIYHN